MKKPVGKLALVSTTLLTFLLVMLVLTLASPNFMVMDCQPLWHKFASEGFTHQWRLFPLDPPVFVRSSSTLTHPQDNPQDNPQDVLYLSCVG